MRKFTVLGVALVLITAVFGLALSAPSVGAGSENKAIKRPIEDFVSAQGTYIAFYIYLVMYDNEVTKWVDIDYAGLLNGWAEWVSGGAYSFGTEISGSVTERPLADGRTHVHVRLHTTNAVTFVREYDSPNDHPYLFGNPAWACVLYGAEPALGDVFMEWKYITPDPPGSPMPDLLQLLIYPEEGQEVLQSVFTLQAEGELHEAFGVEEGTPGKVSVTAKAPFNAPGLYKSPAIDFPNIYPVAHINLRAMGK